MDYDVRSMIKSTLRFYFGWSIRVRNRTCARLQNVYLNRAQGSTVGGVDRREQDGARENKVPPVEGQRHDGRSGTFESRRGERGRQDVYSTADPLQTGFERQRRRAPGHRPENRKPYVSVAVGSRHLRRRSLSLLGPTTGTGLALVQLEMHGRYQVKERISAYVGSRLLHRRPVAKYFFFDRLDRSRFVIVKSRFRVALTGGFDEKINNCRLSVNYTTALLGRSRSYLHVDGPHQQVSAVDEIKDVRHSGVSLLHLETPANLTRHVLPLFLEKKCV